MQKNLLQHSLEGVGVSPVFHVSHHVNHFVEKGLKFWDEWSWGCWGQSEVVLRVWFLIWMQEVPGFPAKSVCQVLERIYQRNLVFPSWMDWDILYRIVKCCLCFVHVSERTQRGWAESCFFLSKGASWDPKLERARSGVRELFHTRKNFWISSFQHFIFFQTEQFRNS